MSGLSKDAAPSPLAGGEHAAPARDLPFTEIWITEHFARFFGEEHKHCKDRGWYYWDNDDGIWVSDAASLRTLRRIQDVCTAASVFARNDPNATSEAAAIRLARQIETAKTVKGVEFLARARPEVAVEAADFDADIWALNTPGGLVDLRTGRIRSAKREDYCTRTTAVAIDQWGDCPEFLAFLDAITCGDRELQDWLQTYLGLLLTGDISMHVLVMLIGAGGNGKSTLLDLVLRILNTYAVKIASSVLMSDRHGPKHLTEIAQLMGARVAVASEVNQGEYLDEARVKELTGDEYLNARFMYRDNFQFRRTHRLVVQGNHRPQIRAIDPALRRRIRFVPFRADFTGKEDRELPGRLWDEAGAILAWMVQGAQAWFEERRLPACKAIDDETAEYFQAQSTVDNWIDLELDQSKPEVRTKAGDLYRAYRAWKEERGEYPQSQTTWGAAMSRRFQKVVSNGVLYVGVCLRPRKDDDKAKLL